MHSIKDENKALHPEQVVNSLSGYSKCLGTRLVTYS